MLGPILPINGFKLYIYNVKTNTIFHAPISHSVDSNSMPLVSVLGFSPWFLFSVWAKSQAPVVGQGFKKDKTNH
jgi:hypothetical protein